MPMFLNPKFPRCQCADFVFNLPFADTGADQAIALDGVEQLQRLNLGGLQFGAPPIFDQGKKIAHDRIGPSRTSQDQS